MSDNSSPVTWVGNSHHPAPEGDPDLVRLLQARQDRMRKDVDEAFLLFEDLCTEILYGFNMKCELRDAPEFRASLQAFIRRCRRARKASDTESCPRCFSDNVREMENVTCTWACGKCGYTGDGAEFDPQETPIPRQRRPDPTAAFPPAAPTGERNMQRECRE